MNLLEELTDVYERTARATLGEDFSGRARAAGLKGILAWLEEKHDREVESAALSDYADLLSDSTYTMNYGSALAYRENVIWLLRRDAETGFPPQWTRPSRASSSAGPSDG